ncbi:hypothetical protein [Streptomyces sp. NPDC093094]|uniref:hypothetical protein n=1 Tax=Streptomyces sp. NPDC093094 TaxID=3366026 RepID=UPI00382FBE0A
MSASNRQSQSRQPAPPGPDPVQTLLMVLVVTLVLGATGYLCLAHPSLTAPIAAVSGVGAALAAVFGIVARR